MQWVVNRDCDSSVGPWKAEKSSLKSTSHQGKNHSSDVSAWICVRRAGGECRLSPVNTSNGLTSLARISSSLTNGAFQYCLAAELAIDLACIIDPAFPGIYNTGTPSGCEQETRPEADQRRRASSTFTSSLPPAWD